jgi:hypothetical protein
MSYVNMIMYSEVLPSYHNKDDESGEVIDADDPRNKEKVEHLLFG